MGYIIYINQQFKPLSVIYIHTIYGVDNKTDKNVKLRGYILNFQIVQQFYWSFDVFASAK